MHSATCVLGPTYAGAVVENIRHGNFPWEICPLTCTLVSHSLSKHTALWCFSFSPEFVCLLDASDEFLKERVMNLPESIVAGTHYSQDRFLRALSNYRDINIEDETVLNYFDEIEIHPIHIGMK